MKVNGIIVVVVASDTCGGSDFQRNRKKLSVIYVATDVKKKQPLGPAAGAPQRLMIFFWFAHVLGTYTAKLAEETYPLT